MSIKIPKASVSLWSFLMEKLLNSTEITRAYLKVSHITISNENIEICNVLIERLCSYNWNSDKKFEKSIGISYLHNI